MLVPCYQHVPKCLAAPSVQIPWHNTLHSYEALLTADELENVQQADSVASRRERLLARVLTRTTLSVALGGAVPPKVREDVALGHVTCCPVRRACQHVT